MTIPLSEYIARKFLLLDQLGICVSGTDKSRLWSAKSEIQCDNIARDIICPPMADMRTM